MTALYAIFDATRLGTSLELERSGTVLAVNALADLNRTALAIQPQSVGRWYAELQATTSAQSVAVSAASDPYWAQVVSLLHCDGVGGSTAFTDVKGLVWQSREHAAYTPSNVPFPNS